MNYSDGYLNENFTFKNFILFEKRSVDGPVFIHKWNPNLLRHGLLYDNPILNDSTYQHLP